MSTTSLRRFTAFADTPQGGNPAGVWIGNELPTGEEMLAIAAEVGYSETAFATPTEGDRYTVRYFSPQAEVPFCGHATIALGARLASDIGPGRYLLFTQVGEVPLDTQSNGNLATATLTSVEPSSSPAGDKLVKTALHLLNWKRTELDDAFVPSVMFAGARHLLLAASTRERLADMEYGFGAMRKLMLENDLTTIDLIWRESTNVFHSRNPFPVGGVVEDPATGAAAAALGGHLRNIGTIATPSTFIIHQGVDMGRPSLLKVDVPAQGGISVTGTAVPIG